MAAQNEERIRQLVRLISDENNPDKIKVMAGELFEVLTVQQQGMALLKIQKPKSN